MYLRVTFVVTISLQPIPLVSSYCTHAFIYVNTAINNWYLDKSSLAIVKDKVTLIR
jgi:hypothetical protein